MHKTCTQIIRVEIDAQDVHTNYRNWKILMAKNKKERNTGKMGRNSITVWNIFSFKEKKFKYSLSSQPRFLMCFSWILFLETPYGAGVSFLKVKRTVSDLTGGCFSWKTGILWTRSLLRWGSRARGRFPASPVITPFAGIHMFCLTDESNLRFLPEIFFATLFRCGPRVW